MSIFRNIFPSRNSVVVGEDEFQLGDRDVLKVRIEESILELHHSVHVARRLGPLSHWATSLFGLVFRSVFSLSPKFGLSES